MCVAGLNVATTPCQHRWYQLVRSCGAERNLANCPDRLRLEGWESRNETCPWCDADQDVPESTHRLFGSMSSASSTVSSPTSPEISSRTHRSGSLGTISTLGSVSRHNSSASTESERGMRQRELNDRLALYLTSQPHEVLPSAKKYYPTSPRDEFTDSDGASIVSASGVIKGWKRTMQMSKSMFKG